MKGEGNSVNYKYRMHDPRLGRFFAVDPLAYKYLFYSPYQFAANNVIMGRELEGLENEITINYSEGHVVLKKEGNRYVVSENTAGTSAMIGAAGQGYAGMDLQEGGYVDARCNQCGNPNSANPSLRNPRIRFHIPKQDVVQAIDIVRISTETIKGEPSTKDKWSKKGTRTLGMGGTKSGSYFNNSSTFHKVVDLVATHVNREASFDPKTRRHTDHVIKVQIDSLHLSIQDRIEKELKKKFKKYIIVVTVGDLGSSYQVKTTHKVSNLLKKGEKGTPDKEITKIEKVRKYETKKAFVAKD